MTGELRLVLRKLIEDRLALLGLIIVGALVFCAVFAPWLSTHPGRSHRIQSGAPPPTAE